METASAETLWKTNSGADTFTPKGNDLELDPNREPEPPVKVIDKPVQRTGKRNAGAEPKAAAGQVPGTWKFSADVVGVARMERGWVGEDGVEMRRREENV